MASILQLLAADTVSALTQPAIAHVLKTVLSENSFSAWCDEYAALIHFAIEFHSLESHGASFGEVAENLKRLGSITKQKAGRYALLLALTIYVERKLQRWFEQLESAHYFRKQSALPHKETLADQFVRSYPNFFTALSVARLVNYAAYAMGVSSFHTMMNRMQTVVLSDVSSSGRSSSVLSLFLCGAALVRLLALVAVQNRQFRAQFGSFLGTNTNTNLHSAERTPIPTPPPARIDVQRLASASSKVVAQIGAVSQSTIEADERADTIAEKSTRTKAASRALQSNLCPICRRPYAQRIPTVLIVSGFVFCASCIRHHLTIDRSCPVTHQTVASAPFDTVTVTLHAEAD